MAAIAWWSIWLALTAVIAVNGATGIQRCYICIPNIGLSIQDVLKLFPSGPEIPLCNKFEPGRKEFVRDCPSDETYIGCMTATNGSHITKTCATIALNDCQTANNVTYCYCAGDLCNAESVPVEEVRPAVDASAESQPNPTNDDEEYPDEGSGSFQESSETSHSRLPTTTHDDVTVEENVQTSVSPENVTSTRPRSAAYGVVANTILLSVCFLVNMF